MPIRTLTFVALCLVSACSGGQPAPRAGTTPPPTSASPSTNQAPEIVVLPLTALAGERYANQILASDTEGDTLSFTLENAPDWLQLSSSGLLTGTPDEDDVGEQSITVVASDPYQTARAVFSLTVELEPLRFALRTGDIRPFRARHGKQTPSLLLDEIRAEHALQRSSPTPPSMSLEQVVFALEQLVAGTLSYDISMCRNAFDCSENAAFHFDIWVPFWEMSYELSEFERGGGSFFPAAPSQKLLTLFVLLGDYYRSDVRFPIDKDRTSSDTFVKALYADASSTVRRQINPAPRDLGNYSRTDFQGVARSSQTVRLISLSSFRTAGVYAFPGEAFQVTRRDQSEVDVYIQVQSIRDIANHPFRGDYNRPVKIASHQIPIGPGETRVLTSPYGGPVHVYFGDGEHQVELEFQ
ncbi:MAG: putative Ig domain-containing protein, partial [Pseudomonadota bacterium]